MKYPPYLREHLFFKMTSDEEDHIGGLIIEHYAEWRWLLPSRKQMKKIIKDAQKEYKQLSLPHIF